MVTIAVEAAAAGITVLRVQGEITGANGPKLDARLQELLATDAHAIIVDLSAARLCGRAGLSALIPLADRAAEANLGLCLVDTKPALHHLATTGLAGLFELHPTLDECVASLAPAHRRPHPPDQLLPHGFPLGIWHLTGH